MFKVRLRSKVISALFICAAAVALPSCAGTLRYRAFDGPTGTNQGFSVDSFSKHGIDWWMHGAPARGFVVMGMLVDDRDGLALKGRAIGSPAVARLVRSHGGEAVVLVNTTASREYPPILTPQLGDWFSRSRKGDAIVDRTTTLLIIRYQPN